MTKTTLYFRIASILTFIHALLHTIGGVFGKAQPGPATVAVEAMKTNQFLLMGHMRSFWDFYHGLGLGISISLTTDAIVFWLLGSLAKTDARRLRPIVVTFAASYAGLAINSNTYFFIGPVIAEIAIVSCLGMAFFSARSESAIPLESLQRA